MLYSELVLYFAQRMLNLALNCTVNNAHQIHLEHGNKFIKHIQKPMHRKSIYITNIDVKDHNTLTLLL